MPGTWLPWPVNSMTTPSSRRVAVPRTTSDPVLPTPAVRKRAAAADARRPAGRRPRLRRGGGGDGEVAPRDVRVRLPQVEVGREAPVLEGQQQLAQAGDAGRRLEVADVGLDRLDEQRLRRRAGGAVHRLQGAHLDRVA